MKVVYALYDRRANVYGDPQTFVNSDVATRYYRALFDSAPIYQSNADDFIAHGLCAYDDQTCTVDPDNRPLSISFNSFQR